MHELKSIGGMELHKGLKRVVGCGTFVIFLMFPAVFIFAENVLNFEGFPMCILFFPMFLVIVVMILLYLYGAKMLFERIRGWKIGQAVATLSDHPLQPGQKFDFSLDQPINGPAQIEQVSVSLIFRETARYTVGTDTRTETRDKVIQQVDLPGRNMQPGNRLYERVELTIPEAAMHSWFGERTIEDLQEKIQEVGQAQAGPAPAVQQPPAWMMNVLGKVVAQGQSWSRYNNTLQWVIRLHVKVKGWLDYVDEYRIDVGTEDQHQGTTL